MALTVAVGFVATSCGSDSKTASTSKPTATTAGATATTAGATATTAGATATTAGATATTAGATATTAGGTSTGTDECGTGDALVAAAKKEGKVNLIALPDSWANYKGILASFRTKYGIDAPVANPDGSSADELTAVETLAGQDDRPEAIDVSPAFAKQIVDDKIVEPFMPEHWDEIPENMKDANGSWVAAYYGVFAIASNSELVKNTPKSWEDLLKPEYKGQVAINGDPRESGSGRAAVISAALANGGSLDNILPGIEYFKKLKDNGNLILTGVTDATVLSGDTPIDLDWTYNFPGLQAQTEAAGFTMNAVVPSDGVYGGYYIQGVVAGSKHPCAARLWINHIIGDDGALGYLEGGAIPARYDALVKSGKITTEMLKNLPSADIIKQVQFLTTEQSDAAKAVIEANWGPMVADS